MEEFRREHCDPAGINMLRINLPMFNPENGGSVLAVFDPEDIQAIYREEGKYPYRGPIFEVSKGKRVKTYILAMRAILVST